MEILYTYEELNSAGFMLGTIGIFGTLLFLGLTINSLLKKKLSVFLFGIFFLLCCFAFSEYTRMIDSKKGFNIYHEVLLKDTTKFDPYKYKVVNKKGKITVIQEIKVRK